MAFIYRLPTRTPADPAATVRATTPNGAHFLPAGDDFPERHMAGSADPLGDDQAERTSAWGALEECAPECAKHREPTDTLLPKPDDWFTVLLGVACVLAVALCAVLAKVLPLFPGH